MFEKFEASLEKIDSALLAFLDAERARGAQNLATLPFAMVDAHSAALWQALAYAIQAGGKRLRPLLTVLTCEALGGSMTDALPTACAIELIHTQSLIHDDLPCMDDDDLRRGQPTLHKATTEATAVLAGDALLAMAFGWIIRYTPRSATISPEILLQLVSELSDAASMQGLVNGQYADICSEGEHPRLENVTYIHRFKTAALFQFTVRAGALLANATATEVEYLGRFGELLGLAFQVVDDVLDESSTSEMLGKTVGKDRSQQKATYPACIGLEASRIEAGRLIQDAKAALSQVQNPERFESLVCVADIVIHRLY